MTLLLNNKKKHSLKPVPQRNWTPILLGTAVALSGLNLLISLGLIVGLGAVASKPVPRLVEDQNGVTRPVVALNTSEPTPKAVSQFVGDTLFQLYNWSGATPSEDVRDQGTLKPDPGVPISTGSNTKNVTTATWKAAFRLESSLRHEHLKKLANLTPQSIFLDKPFGQATLTSIDVGVPEKLGEGYWKVRFVGILLIYDRTNNPDPVPVRHDVFVRAIDSYKPLPVVVSESDQKAATAAGMSDLQKLILDSRSMGLVIESMPEVLGES